MKRSVNFRIFCLFTAFLMLVSAFICGGASVAAAEGFGEAVSDTAVLDNGILRFEIKSNGRFVLTELSSGQRWVSNPAEEVEDKISFGVNKDKVMSQLMVTYSGTGVVSETATFAGLAATDGSYTELYKNGDTVVCVYYLKSLGFVIPIEYSIKDNRLYSEVYTEKVRETEKYRLVDFTLNPFFGAGTTEDDGFIMLPDGSGAVIDFNNGKTGENRLELDVMYGDMSKQSENRPPEVKPVLVPAFGTSKKVGDKNAAMLAFAESGAIGGKITTNVAGRETGCNYAYFTFLFREYSIETMLDRTYAAKTRLVVSDKPQDVDKFSLCYSVGCSEKSGLAAMAEYGKAVIFAEKSKQEKSEIPFFLDIIMGVRVKRNFLGVPYKTLLPLTTFNETNEIIADFNKENINNLEIRMQGLSNDGFAGGKLSNKLSVNRKIGSVKELKQLQSAKGVEIYPQVELVNFTRGGNGAVKFTDSALDLLLDTIRVPKYLLAAAVEDTEQASGRLLAPAKIKKIRSSLEKDLNKKEIEGISPVSLARGSYSDYSKKRASGLSATADVMNENLKAFAENRKIMLDAPIYTAWQYAESIIYLPDDSSHYNICDRTVPFLQMLISGEIPYSSSAVNFSGDNTLAQLECIRNGAAPAVLITAADYSEMNDNDANDLYAANFANCFESASKCYSFVEKALHNVYGYSITDFSEPVPNLTLSTYSNGTTVWVNTSEQAIEWNGTKVMGRSYIITGEVA